MDLEDRLIGASADLGVVVGGDNLPYTYDKDNGVKYKDNKINIKVKVE